MAAEEVEQRVMASNVYQCTACAREFKDKSQLTKHFNMEHSKVSRKFLLDPIPIPIMRPREKLVNHI